MKIKARNRYYISYLYEREDGITGYGSCTWKSSKIISTITDMNKITDIIKEKHDFKTCIIQSIERLV